MSVFIPWHDPAVRLTGRWSRVYPGAHDPHVFQQQTGLAATATAPGSYFELAFEGDMALLHFDLGYLTGPAPHLWISVDGGARIEVPIDRYLRVKAEGEGPHILKVLYKGGMEMLPRWFGPLMGTVSFIGARVERAGTLFPDDRPLIEFVGDSITEGVLVDEDYDTMPAHLDDQFCRPYQDDNQATYAVLTAKNLNLRAMFQAYGAVGLTRSGCGGVPRAGLLYPYVFDGVRYTGETPRAVLINHGANDREATEIEYLSRYRELIETVRACAPDASIICLSAFCGAFENALNAFVGEYNQCAEKPVHFISGAHWVPAEPLHPTRAGHETIAKELTPILRDILKNDGKL